MISFRSIRKLYRQARSFSSVSSLVAPENLVTSFKHGYGQAGTLHTNLQNPKMSIYFKTIWEDHATFNLYSLDPRSKSQLVFQENERNAYLKDSEGPLSEIESVLIAEIPEYYSLNLANNGIVGVAKGDVSSKLCGNVTAKISGPNSGLTLSKIKGEYFHVETEGSLNVTSYLESADFSLKGKNSKIEIKRLGLSGNGKIDYHNGDITLGSVYCGTYSEHTGPKEPVIEIKADQRGVEEMKKNVLEQMKKGHYLELNGSEYKFTTSNFQSSSYIDAKKANLNLGNVEGQRLLINVEEGDVSLTVSKLTTEGIISLKRGSLNLGVEDNARINVYLWKEKAFWRGNFIIGRPILIVDCEEAKVNVSVQEKKDFFAEMREKMKNRERK